MSRTPAAIERAAPLVGEHTSEILSEAGYPPSEIDAMIASGVAGDSQP